jgi:hypothetical protein
MSELQHDQRSEPRPGERVYWLDLPSNVNRLVYWFYGLCGLALVIDPWVTKHGPYSIEHWWGFYGLFGFVACVALVLIAKELRKILMRSEDYYDR